MISETLDVLVPESESGTSYLNLVLVKIRVALKEELEKNEWKIEIADDQRRIVVERLLDVTVVADSLFETGDGFHAPDIDDISYGDLINSDDAVDQDVDLFGALDCIDSTTTAVTLTEETTVTTINAPSPSPSPEPSLPCPPKEMHDTAIPLKRKRGRPKKAQPSKTGIFPCRLCGKQFRQLNALEIHTVKKHASDSGFLCNRCGISFKSKKLLGQHVEKSHDAKTWPCKYCGKHFNNVKHARRHEQSVHLGKTKLNCPTCDKEFSTKENLGRHVQTIHEGKKVLCEICGKGFSAAHSMKIHVELVHMQKRIPCNFCGKEMSEVHLQRHIRSIHQGVRYNCDCCEKSFDRPYRLKQHKMKVHKDKDMKDDHDDKEDSDNPATWLNIPVAESLEIVGTEEDFLKIPL